MRNNSSKYQFVKNTVIVHRPLRSRRRGRRGCFFYCFPLRGRKTIRTSPFGHSVAPRNGKAMNNNSALKLNCYAAKLLSSFLLPSSQRQRKNYLPSASFASGGEPLQFCHIGLNCYKTLDIIFNFY